MNPGKSLCTQQSPSFSFNQPTTLHPSSSMSPFFFRGKKKKETRGGKTKRWLCAPGTVDRAGVRPVICKQKDCVRRLGETGISDGGREEEGGIPGLWFLACLIIRHMYAPFSPPVLPPGNNMLFVHPGAFASEIRTTARN